MYKIITHNISEGRRTALPLMEPKCLYGIGREVLDLVNIVKEKMAQKKVEERIGLPILLCLLQ